MPEEARRPRGRACDPAAARGLLERAFAEAEALFANGLEPPTDAGIAARLDVVFASATQAFREVLAGCALVRLVDPGFDIRLPYANHGDRAFNGRTLDEQVVNPFLQARGVPCSRGPYLSTFRRSVRFVPETGQGIRDKTAYAGFLDVVTALEDADTAAAASLLLAIAYRFVRLRERERIDLVRVNRMSLPQFRTLLGHLLGTPSGGLIPVMIATAVLRGVAQHAGLGWTIECQGINVADRASGVGGDVTVSQDGRVLFAVEVTERPIDEARLVSTFRTKIAVHSLSQYVFLHTGAPPTDEALRAAERYFSQGHDIVFFAVADWAATTVGTFGPDCRALCLHDLVEQLGVPGVRAFVRMAWNDALQKVIG